MSIDYKSCLAAASLLHDIGKFIRRSGKTNTTHHYASYLFVMENLKGKGIFRDEEVEFIANLVRYHHDEKDKEVTELEGGKNNIFLKILKESDSDSASERKEYKGEMEGSIEDEPLTNILSAVNGAFCDDCNLNDIKVNYPKTYYPFAFTDKYEGRDRTKAEAENQYYLFLRDFIELINLKPSRDEFIISLNYLLKKYTSYITSSGKELIRDISLYHHTFTTAAFALCRLLDYEEYGHRKEQEYKIVFGRIFNIQNYIFNNLNKNIEKPLKRILTRSNLITLINTIIPYQIVRRLELYPFNIIFSGGGSFLIIIPKTQEENAKKVLDEIQEDVSRLFENKVYFEYVIEDLIVREDAKEYSFEKYFKEAAHNVNLKKFSRSLNSLKMDLNKKYHVCRNCDINTEKEDLCAICDIENKWMNVDLFNFKIPYEKAEIKNILNPEIFDLEGRLNLFFNYNIARDQRLVVDVKEIGMLRIKRSEDFCKNCQEKCDIALNSDISLNCFANISKNDTIVATAKIDVDDLYFLLYEVYPFEFKNNEKGERYPFSISRLSFLSSVIDSFFTSYTKHYIERYAKDKILLLYSGGDDLLITGGYEDVINFVIAFEKEFGRYISEGEKREITLTSAIVFHKSNKPFNRVMEKLNDMMERAKRYKNCVMVNDILLKYNQLELVNRRSDDLRKIVSKKYISRKLIYDMIKIMEMNKKGAIFQAKRAALYNYYINRNVLQKEILKDKEKDREIKEKIEKLFNSIVNVEEKQTRLSIFILELALRKTKTRGGEDE
ncbi:MAG: type III-A CRISPR-associated protein Cas10/Csm1 [Caloramator sp.]|nr:type III-A CRISPR-associated protein Cas10/Csm1 [Caloramator sp.]